VLSRHLCSASVALALAVLASAARADLATGTQLPDDVPAVTDEGARALAALRQLAPRADGAPSDAARSIATARKALARAHGAHLAGDVAGARRLGRVALAWTVAARAQLAAAAAERASATVEREALELAESRDRARALLVEAQARKGQLGARVEQKKRAVEAAKAPPVDPKASAATKAAPAKVPAAAASPRTAPPRGAPAVRAPSGGGRR
jgi:hypothetical protein